MTPIEMEFFMSKSIIKFDHVSKIFPDGTKAVDDVSFEIYEGECVTFVGPSGCGKTTTVKLLNRLVEPTEGSIYLNGEDTSKVDVIALRRNIGYVIQEVGLFPHMTVAQNISLVPKLIGWKPEERKKRTEELLNLVGLDPKSFSERYPHQLSGGQRQRVGVARGLAADPPVILMDEPFGALDPITRAQLQEEFIRLRFRLKKTILFVTHDIDEAIKLGDRIAIMRNGKIIQFDTPKKVLREPENNFVKNLIGKDSGFKLMKLSKLEDIMMPINPIVKNQSIKEAKRLMNERSSDILLVVDEKGVYEGVIYFEDIQDHENGPITGIIRRDIFPCNEGETIRGTIERMLREELVWIPIIDQERRLRGIVTMSNFAIFFAQE